MNKNPAPLLGPQGTVWAWLMANAGGDVLGRALGLRTDVDTQARSQHVEQRDEDRQLGDERQAGPQAG